MKTQDAQLVEILNGVIEWHQNRVESCMTIINNTDAEIHLEGVDTVLAADSSEAQWLRIGVSLALQQFKKFPLSIRTTNEDDFDDE